MNTPCALRTVACAFAVASVLLCAACRTAPSGPGAGGTVSRPLIPPPRADGGQPLPTYAEAITRYNASGAAGLERFFARVGVEIAWTEADGSRRDESGAGSLLYRNPRDTALSVSVLGNTLIWAGSNSERWWVFSELHRDGHLQDGPLDGAAEGAGGLPFRPDAVPLVLGLTRIDPNLTPPQPSIEGINGFWLVEPPGLGARLLLDPETGRPVRVDLLGEDGRSRVVVRLDGAVPVADGAPGATLPELIDAYPLDGGSRLTLTVRSAKSDDRSLQDRLFRLGDLIEYHRPATRGP